ncbi:alpha-L-arabinofuranosidase C-terminal domain-containing protein [Thermotoga sp. SG1]|uniref:alpha-L-arabinofuranosidase C-terminal domain-containing protein n=1 Tax=Thermotoga sp. SG1 TaxID=126739 RepID=UPI000C784AB8|nr:alpha-L-arabinofuranosidase C-terminal domain-containing protein [Thermotoga sp. SG1]PLV57442.1 alpha-N-arabinofuranosidase [Thermotoga sp. SG1]
MKKFVFILLLLVSISLLGEVQHVLTIDFSQQGPRIPETLHGIFFEDINHAVDGGLYVELVRNRSFEQETRRYEGWRVERGDFVRSSIEETYPLNENNTRYLEMRFSETDRATLTNLGYGGIAVFQGQEYTFSTYLSGGFSGTITVMIVDDDEILASGRILLQQPVGDWKKYTLDLVPTKTSTNSELSIVILGKGILRIDMVSLMPKDNWNGMRKDLVKMIEELKPGFMRFPGGCLVQGNTLENAYRWKESIGPIEQRKTKWNFWGYYQTLGIGFYEYLLLCEKLGAEPVPIFNPGISFQIESPEYASEEELKEWIQDVLDFLEFANGATDTYWGGVRASLGHPEPFNVKYIGVGNENWGPRYWENFERFRRAIKEKYPNVKIIFSGPPSYEGTDFRQAWRWARENNVEIFDEHIYASPEWMLANTDRYDKYDRNGPKVMLGEYAAHTDRRRNNWQAALAEAAFLTGVERNSDVVIMASYAPLFNRVGWSQWVPDLIWFDNYRVFGTPSYYVQKIFAENKGDVVVYSELTNEEYRMFGYRYKYLYQVVTYDEKSQELIIKIVNPWSEDRSVRVDVRGITLDGTGKEITLKGDPKDENNFDELRIVPEEKIITGLKNSFEYTFKAHSVTVLKLKVEE